MAIRTVGVLGCGLMGSGIAQSCAASGHHVVVLEPTAEAVRAGLARIDRFLAAAVEKGKMAADEKAAILGRITGTSHYADLARADLVIEAIVEDLPAKRHAYAAVEAVVRPDCLLVSNTSSLCITELAATTTRPAQFAGLHFFNPVPLMKLVEVIRGLATSQATMDALVSFARGLGKDPVTAPDRGGFIVNRLLVPYLLDAIRALEQGLGTTEDIDKAMTLGCGYPMGPFTLLDFVGLDTTLAIANILFDEFRETRFAPPPLLRRMVLAGHLGRKSGKGFYEYARG